MLDVTIRRLLSKNEAAVRRYVLPRFPLNGRGLETRVRSEEPTAVAEPVASETHEDSSENVAELSDEEQSAVLVEEARVQVFDEGYQKGYEAGLQEGREKGYQEGAQEVEAQLTTTLEEHFNFLLQALKTGTETLAGDTDRLRQQFEEWLPRAVLLVAECVLRHEVQTDAESLARVVRESMADLSPSALVKVHLHPTDYERLAEQPPEVWNSARLTFLADKAISQGGALIETETQVIDARIESRLLEAARSLLFPQELEESQ